MDTYLDPFSKIALTLTASQLAKSLIVKTEGIGEDLSFNFFAWRDGHPLLCAQLDSGLMKEDHGRRFERCLAMLGVLRFRLGITGLTFVAEGYVAPSLQKKELSLAFIDPNSRVKECLTVIHCEESMQPGTPDVYLFSLPYEYRVGRDIKWGQLMEFSQNATKTIEKYAYPSMMQRAFSRQVDEDAIQAPIDEEVYKELNDFGFLVEEF